MSSSNRNIIALIFFVLAVIAAACSRTREAPQQNSQETIVQEPSIEAAPLKQGNGSLMIATSETVTFTVTAPEAKGVRILHKPVAVSGGHFVLKKTSDPTEAGSGKFSAQLKLAPDFNGTVWAEALYADGAKRQTEPITLSVEAGDTTQTAQGTSDGDDSARSNKITGGKIERITLKEGQPDVKISVNVPAFLLTLWQNGKEVKTYDVGIGRKNFPIVIGERKADKIIFNPNWVPPDSEWVRESAGVEPFEKIEADDPRNPLGSLKIPLGDAYLIHQAASPSDIGNLVSHGCIRMLKEDIFDLAEKIIMARGLPVPKQEIESLKSNTERRVVQLDTPITVDINYDTQVIEGGMLHIYPDVYDRQVNTVENLRADLQQAGIDDSKLDEQALKKLIERASMSQEFMVSVADVSAGRALSKGKNQPLTKQPDSGKDSAKDKTKRSANRSRP